MKKILFLIITIFSHNLLAEQSLTLEMVTKQVKEQNLTVLGNAEKVYQANASIDEARKNLLPKLNIWSLGKVIIDPSALLDVGQEFAPFLVPSNWFRLKETEILYQAEKEGYVALRANEIFAGRSLYIKVLMDQDLYNSLLNFEKEYATINGIIEDRVDLGLEAAEIGRQIKVQFLNIQEDIVKLKLLVDYEKSVLAQSLGLPVNDKINLAPVDAPSEETNLPINSADWEKLVLDKSPEINQFEYFLKVIPQIKKEIRFSFLGVPSVSRGTAGGVFDDMPVSQGLGFANGVQMDIINSKSKVLELQKKGIEETLKRQVLNVSQEHNSSLELRDLRKSRLNLSELNFKSYSETLSIGGHLSLAEFSQSVLSLLQSQSSYYETYYGFIINYDRLQRMSFTGAYKSIENDRLPKKEVERERECRKTIFGRVVCK